MTDDEWRKEQICHTCTEKNTCKEGKIRYYYYGPIVVKCTKFKEEK